MTTVSELRDACREWLDDPAHQPNFSLGAGQDQYDLKRTRNLVTETMFACNALLRNSGVLQTLREAQAVKELLG